MNYTSELEEAIVSRHDAADLAALATDIGEVYPTSIVESIRRLAECGKLAPSDATRLQRFTPQPFLSAMDGLPVPHPLDADWRLDQLTRQRMVRRLVISRGSTPVLLLGVPTVHREMQIMKSPSLLIDVDAAILSSGLPSRTLIIGDVGRMRPLDEPVRMTFADPPWYLPATKSFLWFAARSTVVGGQVLISMAGRLTRPGIEDEREEIRKFAATVGLRLADIEQHALRYDSPPFERASLEAAGFAGFPSIWRCGDLAIFTKENEGAAEAPNPVVGDVWQERVIGGVRIRFKMKDVSTFDPVPFPLGESRVRLTVSARDPLIHRIDVWTSGNQVFTCENPSQLAVIADALSQETWPIEMVERSLRRTLRSYEHALVERARLELERIVELDYTRLQK